MLTRDINYSGIVEELKQEPSHTRALLINTCLCGSAVTQRTHTYTKWNYISENVRVGRCFPCCLSPTQPAAKGTPPAPCVYWK